MKFIIYIYLICICVVDLYAGSGYIKNISNPFLNRVLEIKNCVEYAPNIFNSIKKDMPNAKNRIVYKVKLFDSGNNIRMQQEFELNDGTKNIRDLYATDNDVVCIDSISPLLLRIHSINDSLLGNFEIHWYRDLFLGVFEDLKKIKELSAIKTDSQLILNWQNEYDYILKYDLKSNIITEYTVRKKNGCIHRSVTFYKKSEDSWDITSKLYNGNNELFVTNRLQVRITNDPKFSSELIPTGFGYREVMDNRANLNRRYIAMNKLPSRTFIDELFKNQDDVERYNIEMSRFSPLKCKICSGKE